MMKQPVSFLKPSTKQVNFSSGLRKTGPPILLLLICWNLARQYWVFVFVCRELKAVETLLLPRICRLSFITVQLQDQRVSVSLLYYYFQYYLSTRWFARPSSVFRSPTNLRQRRSQVAQARWADMVRGRAEGSLISRCGFLYWTVVVRNSRIVNVRGRRTWTISFCCWSMETGTRMNEKNPQ